MGELSEALKGVIDDAGDAFVYGRMIRGDVPEPEHLARSNDLARRIALARAAIAKAEAA